jgi:cytochrome oxidase assembly protein ShyY1
MGYYLFQHISRVGGRRVFVDRGLASVDTNKPFQKISTGRYPKMPAKQIASFLPAYVQKAVSL